MEATGAGGRDVKLPLAAALTVIADPGIPEDAAMLISGGPSLEGCNEIADRFLAGEDLSTVYAEVMVREKRVVIVKGIGKEGDR